MASVGVAYVIALALRWPLGPIAAIGACVTLAIASIPPRSALRHVSLSTFALLAGLFALLDAVARAEFVTGALRGSKASPVSVALFSMQLLPAAQRSFRTY
jgi:Na+/H+ antiporter NhaD/arsenite permease-like protein